MAEIVREFLLRYRSPLPSSLVRASTILRGCFDSYSPQTWLLLYYPLLYFAKVVKRLQVLHSGRDNEIQPNGKPVPTNGRGLRWILAQVNFDAAAISIVILGPLVYALLFRYCLLESDFWKRRLSTHPQLRNPTEAEADNPDSLAQRVPDQLLRTSPEVGLSKDEVITLQRKYGPNEIWNGRNWAFVLLRLSIGPANLLLEAVVVLASYFHDWRDLVIVCGLLALNVRAAIHAIREYDEIARSLAWDSSKPVIVLREGKSSKVTARELVPGDVVHVSEGSWVPADGRIVTLDRALYMDQSAITGKSDPIEKQRGDTCYATTGVVRGDALLMVFATGHQTFIGRTKSLIGDPMPDRQPLMRGAIPRHVTAFHGLLRIIGTTVCALSLAPILINCIFGSPTLFSHQILELAVGLLIVSVASSPNIVVSAYRARGAARLMEDGGLVQSELKGVESLAGINILCCDQTGTITENRLTLLEPYCIFCDPEDLILTACLSSSPDKENLDPIEKVMAKELERYPKAKADLNRYKVLNWQPFDVETKLMQSSVESPLGERWLCVKGAPKAVLEIYLQDHPNRADIKETYTSMARDYVGRGIRPLAIARKRENDKWELLGLAPMLQPPRFDSASTVRIAKTLGVSVKIFTGNVASIAKNVCQSIGMSSDIFDAESIDVEGEIPTPEIIDRIEAADAYVELDSVHKEKIVRVLQNRGHLVAATGDGVEDAPLLRRADCGIAVEGSTEIAQAASHIVFHKTSGLSPIVRAMQTSRQIFHQLNNYITYRTTLSQHLLVVMLWYFAAYNEVLDVRFLVLNIHISDMVGFSLGSDDANTPFSKKPQRWSSRRLWADVIALNIILATGSWFSLLAIPEKGATDLESTSSVDLDKISARRSEVLFLNIVLSDHWMSLLTRTNGRFWAYSQNQQVLWILLCVDLLATLLCLVGWTGQGHGTMVMVASWVWLVSIGTFCVAAGLRCMISDGDLLHRPLGGKTGE